MTTTELQIECAKLDGAKLCWTKYFNGTRDPILTRRDGLEPFNEDISKYKEVWNDNVSDYLTYNAIIPLIQKQTIEVQVKMIDILQAETKHEHFILVFAKVAFNMTTAQLAIALLKATGRYKE